MQKFEERIGVKIPGKGHYMATVLVGPLDEDEAILRRLSTIVGTIFNVTGTKYEVVSSEPFKMKVIARDGEPVVEDEPVKAKEAPKEIPRKSEPPESTKRVSLPPEPAVGEVWKPRDPRRIASFTVMAIEDGHAVTDDGRRIQLARFPRYERVSVSQAKVS